MGAYIRGGYIWTRFCVSNINHLLTWLMARVLVNWWSYTWGGGLIFRGLQYMKRCQQHWALFNDFLKYFPLVLAYGVW